MTELKPEDFPLLCETCLGENPYLRMTKEKYGKACKICDRPFTVFRWKPGPRARFKKTEICPTCSKLKNVCQTCVLDLQFGLPVQVRDEALTKAEKTALLHSMPVSQVNRDWMFTQIGNKLNNNEQRLDVNALPYNKLSIQNNYYLNSIKRKEPYYKRNLPHICSFFVKGTCNRGDACPYRHEIQKDIDESLAHQNIRDRFYGVNDPVARKILNRTKDLINDKRQTAPEPPMDRKITTLWVGGLIESITKEHLDEKFREFGNLIDIHFIKDRKCAFIQFEKRENAETCMKLLYDNCFIQDNKYKLDWGKPRKTGKRTSIFDRLNDSEFNNNNNNNNNDNNDLGSKMDDMHEEKQYIDFNDNSNNNNNNNNNYKNKKKQPFTKPKPKPTSYSQDQISYLESQGLYKPHQKSSQNTNQAPPPPGMVPQYNNKGYGYYTSMMSHYRESLMNKNDKNDD